MGVPMGKSHLVSPNVEEPCGQSQCGMPRKEPIGQSQWGRAIWSVPMGKSHLVSAIVLKCHLVIANMSKYAIWSVALCQITPFGQCHYRKIHFCRKYFWP